MFKLKQTSSSHRHVTCSGRNIAVTITHIYNTGGGGRRGHDRMVFGCTTTYAISAYHQ